MESRIKLFRLLLLIAVLLIFNSYQALAQNKINILAGVGIPEFLNAGINFQHNQTQFGIRIGSWPTDEKMICFSGDLYYHFSGISTLSTRRVWYARFGLVYLLDETETIIDKYVYLNSRIGRDFNISKKIGIEIDAGLIVQLSHNEKIKKSSDFWNIVPKPSIVPSIGIAMFYRI